MHANFAALKQASTRAQCASDIARCNATGFDVARITNATQQAFGSTGGFTLFKASHISEFLRFVHAGMEVARVVLQSHWGLVGEGFDEIAFANFVLANTCFPSRAADQTLEQVSGFGATSATVGVNRCGVGKPCIDFDIHLRRAVLASQKCGVQNRRNSSGEGRQIGA